MDNPTLPAQPTAPAIDGGEKALAILCHLSFFLGVGFLLPLIVVLIKHKTGTFAEVHAREVLNFHISAIIFGIIFGLLSFFLIGIPLLMMLVLMIVICAIIGAVRAADGSFYYYPLTIRFLN